MEKGIQTVDNANKGRSRERTKQTVCEFCNLSSIGEHRAWKVRGGWEVGKFREPPKTKYAGRATHQLGRPRFGLEPILEVT